MSCILYIRLLILSILVCDLNSHGQNMLELSDAKRIQLGREQYDSVLAKANIPNFGECWTKAVEFLHEGCRQLTEDVQSRMALGFTNCFLKTSGINTYPCDKDTALAECVSKMDSNGFTAYSNFFTHTHNMCHFLRSQVWHDATIATIEQLSALSSSAISIMEDNAALQKSLLSNHEATIESSQQAVQKIVEDMKSTTSEQRLVIVEILDKLTNLRSLVLSEISWLYAVVYYVALLLIVHLVTSHRRTADARLWIYAILMLSFAVERYSLSGIGQWFSTYISQYLTHSSESDVDSEDAETMYSRIWLFRKFSIALAVLTLIHKGTKFVDYNVLFTRRLDEIVEQNLQIRRQMQDDMVKRRTERQSWDKTEQTNCDTPDGKSSANLWRGTELNLDGSELDLDYDISTDEEGETSSTSATSDTDDSASEDVEERGLDHENGANGKSGAAKDITSSHLSCQNFRPDQTAAIRGPGPLMSRRRVSMPASMFGCTKLKTIIGTNDSTTSNGTRRSLASQTAKLQVPAREPYNLRDRSRTAGVSTSGSGDLNEILNNESAADFACLIDRLSSVSKRNSTKVAMIRRKSTSASSTASLNSNKGEKRQVSSTTMKRVSARGGNSTLATISEGEQ